jgi:hypothetical protein
MVASWVMPRRRQVPLFLLVIIDKDAKTFAVEGPMIDDRRCNNAVCDAQQTGRMVRCCSTQWDKASTIRYWEAQGLKLVDHIVFATL